MQKLSELTKNPQNPRRISEKKREMLRKSVEQLGCLDGVVWNRRLQRLIGGHQRQDLDAEALVHVERQFDPPTPEGTVAEGFVMIKGIRFPYREVDFDEPTDKLANIAANKGAGEWDFPQLREWMLDLDALNVDMELTMFDDEERENLIVPVERVPPGGDADHIPAAPKEPKTVRGDLWRLGDHLLLCGDAVMVDDAAKLMGSEKAALVVTDPPYNVNYGGDHPEGTPWKHRKIENDHMSAEDFKTFTQSWAANIAAFAHGCIYVFGPPGPDGRIMFSVLDELFHCSTTIVWNKDRFVLGRGKYHNKYEPCWFGWYGDGTRFVDDRTLTNVWDVPRPASSDLHPTMKPVELIEIALRHASKPGDIVLDLFGGSGTTLIACEKTTRAARIMEISPAYCDVIVRRWEEYSGQKAELMAP